MNRLALITVLAASAPAFADDSTTSTEATGSGDATVNTGGASGSMNANATASVDGTMSTGWSPQLLYSAQTMPAAGIGIAGTFVIYRYTAPVMPPVVATTVTVEGLGVAGAYGINDKLTAGLTYAFKLHPGGTIKGPLALYAAYNVMHEGKLSVTVGADFDIDVNNTKNVGIGLGASIKYLLAPKIALYTGNPIPIGPAGDQLGISFAKNGPIGLAIPAGVALQPTPEIFAYVDLTLMNIALSPKVSGKFLFADQIGVNAGALYRATPELDVGVSISDNFKDAGGTYAIGLTGRYYIHK